MDVWNRCHPSQHVTSGKLVIAVIPLAFCEHCTTIKRVYVIGKKRTVTNRGTIWARITKGKVNLNFFFVNE